MNANAAANLQLMSTATFPTEPAKPFPWLWDGFLARGMISLLTSRWKAGKTTLISLLLSRLTRGETTFADSPVAAGNAVILTEEPVELWQERHRELNFGAGIHWSCRPFQGRPSPEQWLTLIRDLVAVETDLVVLDPLAMFLPGMVENNSAALIDALEPLHRLTEAGTAVLLVHHPRKGGPQGELSPRGSGALTGLVDILIDLDRPPGSNLSDRTRRLTVTSRLRASFRRIIELSADGHDYVVLAAEQEGFEAGWPVIRIVLEDSSSKPTRKKIQESWPDDYEKPSRATLARWLDRAHRENLIERHGKGRSHSPYRYCLPGQVSLLEELPELEPLHYEFEHSRP